MAKTERILGNLPPAYAPFPRPSALFAIADAVGAVLQDAENHLVEVMKAHWIDHADRGRDEVRDLDQLGALFGVAHWPGEEVEAFRQRLKRHIRALFAGTATVAGVLRVAAGTLGLGIDAERVERPGRLLVPGPTDAGPCVLGSASAARGADAAPASVRGASGLGGGVDLRSSPTLAVVVDATPHDVDLLVAAADPAHVRLEEITAALNGAFGSELATEDGDAVSLRSAAVGVHASLAFPELEASAATALFGLPPRVVQGADARPGTVPGAVDLSAGIDLRQRRFLRLTVDGAQTEELELTGADPAAVTLAELRAQIDAAFGAAVTADGPTLTLSSPSAGAASSIAVERAAGDDAAEVLLGTGVHGFHQGADARPARLAGRTSLSAGVDLSGARLLSVTVGAGSAVEIDCAGADPQRSMPDELVERINTALGQEIASHDGVFLALTAPDTGAASRLAVQPAARDDASEALLGLLPRTYAGADASAARLEGRVAIRPHVNLERRRHLQLSVDDGRAATIDVAGARPDRTTAGEIAAAIDDALGVDVASVSDDRVVLTSPTSGTASTVHFVGQDLLAPAPFVSRAAVLDEAATLLFGAVGLRATATAAQPARVVGSVDLTAGVDLRDQPYLRIGVDGAPPIDVDCRGERPRVTTADEIAGRIDAALGRPVASVDAGRLTITSPTSGRASRVVLGSATAGDAAALLLGTADAAVGTAATGVTFVGARDLSAGVFVDERSLLRIAIDDAPAIEVDLSAGLPGPPDLAGIRLDTAEIARRINAALGGEVASSNGFAVTIASPTAGPAAGIAFAVPGAASRDATAAVFGIQPPRTYRGAPASAAVLTGPALPATLDLGVRRHLRLALRGAEPVDVDCAGTDPAATTPEEVVERIAGGLGAGVAELLDGRLTLMSAPPGEDSSILVLPATVGDARAVVLGTVPDTSRGTAAAPAALTGEPVLRGFVDLSGRGRLRIAVGDHAPADVAVAGAEPSRTTAEEVVAAINQALAAPLASLTADGHLLLTADDTLALPPLRHLTLHEFPPVPVAPPTFAVIEGSEWTVTNASVEAEPLTITFVPDRGVVGPAFLELGTLARTSVPGPVGSGEPVVLPTVRLPPGASTWRFTSCDDSRFDAAVFGDAFAGGVCRSPGVFDVSRFGVTPPAGEHAVFAGGVAAAGGQVTFSWAEHLPGRFDLELPADLPAHFGARFAPASGEGVPPCPPGVFAPRFSGSVSSADSTVVFEDAGIAGSIVDWIAERSGLLEAEFVTLAPPGVTPQRAPWSDPVRLAGGGPTGAARLLAFEDGLDAFVEIRARTPGAHGNGFAVTLAAGAQPGSYQITLDYAGDAVFEVARERVHAALLPARAAGVQSTVSRTNHDV